MNRHEKLIISVKISFALIICFCVFAVTYAITIDANKSSVMRIESQSIVYEQELAKAQEELSELQEKNRELSRENLQLNEENDALKKSVASVVRSGSYISESLGQKRDL